MLSLLLFWLLTDELIGGVCPVGSIGVNTGEALGSCGVEMAELETGSADGDELSSG